MPEVDERIHRFIDKQDIPIKKGPGFTFVVNRLLQGLASLLLRMTNVIETSAIRWQHRLVLRTEAMKSSIDPLRRELADHMRDAYDRQIEIGKTPDEAWEHVTRHFGDYQTILEELETLHHVPSWSWISRLMAVPLVLILFFTLGQIHVGLRYPIFLHAMDGLLVFGAAPLAAFNPRDWGWPVWIRFITRTLALSLMLISFRGCGFLWPFILPVALGVVLTCATMRPFSSLRFTTRLRSYILVVLLAHLALALSYIFTRPNITPIYFGMGVASIFISIVYSILFGRPNWKILAFFSLLVPTFLYKSTIYLAPDPVRFLSPIFSDQFFMAPLIGTLIAVLLLWIMYDCRRYTCWLPAAGVMAMIFTIIGILTNVNDPSKIHLLSSSLLPLILWIAPGIGWVRQRTQKS